MKGFSLIEVIVVVGIFGVLSAVSFSVYGSMRSSAAPRHATQVYVDALRDASLKAKVMMNDTSWGVKLTDNDAVVFSGNTYAGRTQSRDRAFDVPSSLSISGPTEIVFTKFTGIPTTSGTTTFSNGFATTSVVVMPSGAIDY